MAINKVFVPLVDRGEKIQLYTSRSAATLWFHRFEKELKVLSNFVNEHGNIPVSGKGLRFPGTSTIPHEEGIEYKTISERGLYQAMLNKQATIVKNDLIQLDEEYGASQLWKWHCQGEWDKIREVTNPPIIWLDPFKDMSYTNPSTNWVEYPCAVQVQGDKLTKIEILDDDQLVPCTSNPAVLKAVAIFNSLILYEKDKDKKEE